MIYFTSPPYRIHVLEYLFSDGTSKTIQVSCAMPEKNWEAHQAEITQLYFTEGKTLDEVRDTLQGHGFEAS